jgi:hypothetical protein
VYQNGSPTFWTPQCFLLALDTAFFGLWCFQPCFAVILTNGVVYGLAVGSGLHTVLFLSIDKLFLSGGARGALNCCRCVAEWLTIAVWLAFFGKFSNRKKPYLLLAFNSIQISSLRI